MTSPTPDPVAPPPGGVRDLMVRSRVLAVVVLFCVALAGGLSAIVFERFVLRAGPPGPGSFGWGGGPWRERAPFGHGEFAHGFPARGRAGWAHPTRERFGRELGLSREQQARIDSLMERQLRELRAVRERVQPQVDSIVAQTHREIDAILTPEQRAKVRALRPPPGTNAGAGRGGPPGPGDGPVMGPGPGIGDQDQPPPAPDGAPSGRR